jgi:hypothetical protein
VKRILLIAAVAAGLAPSGDIHIPTETGFRTLTGREAESYHATNAYLADRLKEAQTIRVGSTYADVLRHFHRDGGISPVTKHRFVMILCPYLKIDVEFESEPGVKARSPVPPTARVVSVSKPYFEPEYGD